MAARKTYKKKGTAKKARKKGQSVYKVKGGYRISRKKRKGVSLVIMLVVLAAMAVCLSGCFEALNGAAETGQKIAETAQDVLVSPAGQLVPEPFRTGAEIAAGAIALIAGYWLKRGKDLYKTATAEIIAGGEKLKAEGDCKEAFSAAQAAEQSKSTKKIVASIKAA